LAATSGRPRYAQSLAKFLVDCPDPRYREFTRATELMRQAAEQGPENAEYRSTLGLVLYRAGKYQESQDSLRHAAKLQPPTASALCKP